MRFPILGASPRGGSSFTTASALGPSTLLERTAATTLSRLPKQCWSRSGRCPPTNHHLLGTSAHRAASSCWPTRCLPGSTRPGSASPIQSDRCSKRVRGRALRCDSRRRVSVPLWSRRRRDRGFRDAASRRPERRTRRPHLPAAHLSGLRIGWIRVTRELELVSLRSGRGPRSRRPRHMAHDRLRVRSNSTLGFSDPRVGTVGTGLTWRSRREPDGFAYVLFADRCPEPVSKRPWMSGLCRRMAGTSSTASVGCILKTC